MLWPHEVYHHVTASSTVAKLPDELSGSARMRILQGGRAMLQRVLQGYYKVAISLLLGLLLGLL